MEKTTAATRAILKARDRHLRAYRIASDLHAHTPLMHERVDARTHARRQSELADINRFIQEGGTGHIMAREEPKKTPEGTRAQPRKSLGAAIQSEKNRRAGRPEMPTSFESGTSGETSSPSFNSGTSDSAGDW